MSHRSLAVHALWISVALVTLASVLVAGIQRQPDVADSDACSFYKGQASEGYKRAGSTLFLGLPGGGKVTLQNFRNGAGGIMLTIPSADPSLPRAEIKC